MPFRNEKAPPPGYQGRGQIGQPYVCGPYVSRSVVDFRMSRVDAGTESGRPEDLALTRIRTGVASGLVPSPVVDDNRILGVRNVLLVLEDLVLRQSPGLFDGLELAEVLRGRGSGRH